MPDIEPMKSANISFQSHLLFGFTLSPYSFPKPEANATENAFIPIIIKNIENKKEITHEYPKCNFLS